MALKPPKFVKTVRDFDLLLMIKMSNCHAPSLLIPTNSTNLII
jgi:hypothetical protein